MSVLGKITEAVVRVMPDREQDELRRAHRYIGQPIDRLDGREKVTGEARFSAEYPVENLAHATLVYSFERQFCFGSGGIQFGSLHGGVDVGRTVQASSSRRKPSTQSAPPERVRSRVR